MRIKIEDKIQRINDERIIIKKIIEKNLVDGANSTCDEISRLTDVLKIQESHAKEYKAIIDAKKLILSLSDEIMQAKNIEDIKKIRTKLNYYINKVKRELKKRVILDEELDSLMESASYLRKGISKYIRFLKREDNLMRINSLYGNSNLNEDENKEFKKLLRNELNYNKRNLNIDSKKDKKIEDFLTSEINANDKAREFSFNNWVLSVFGSDIPVVENSLDEPVDFDDKRIDELSKNDDSVNRWASKVFSGKLILSEKDNGSDEKLFDFNLDSILPRTDTTKSDTDLWKKKFLDDTLIKFNDNPSLNVPKAITNGEFDDNNCFANFGNRYMMDDMYSYTGSHFSNCVSCFKNIARCIHNKKNIGYMKHDAKTYYEGLDFLGYIEYSKKRNSIMRLFKQLFSSSYMHSRENECLNNHDLCYKWINEYYKDSSKTKSYSL